MKLDNDFIISSLKRKLNSKTNKSWKSFIFFNDFSFPELDKPLLLGQRGSFYTGRSQFCAGEHMKSKNSL